MGESWYCHVLQKAGGSESSFKSACLLLRQKRDFRRSGHTHTTQTANTNNCRLLPAMELPATTLPATLAACQPKESTWEEERLEQLQTRLLIEKVCPGPSSRCQSIASRNAS